MGEFQYYVCLLSLSSKVSDARGFFGATAEISACRENTVCCGELVRKMLCTVLFAAVYVSSESWALWALVHAIRIVVRILYKLG